MPTNPPPGNYDTVMTILKGARAFLLAALFVVGISFANWLSDDALVTSALGNAPMWLKASLLPLLHAAGVAFNNWLKHYRGSDNGADGTGTANGGTNESSPTSGS